MKPIIFGFTSAARPEKAVGTPIFAIMNLIDPSKLTVAEFITNWLSDWAATNVSPKTYERYAGLLRLHVSLEIGAVPVQKLSVLDLTQLYRKLSKKGLAGRSVLHVHRVIHRMLRHAVQWRIVQSNVASTVDAPKAEAAEIEILDSARAKDVLEKLLRRNTTGARLLYTIVTTALGTGARRGELLALRWQDVDLDGAVLRIERSLEQTKAKGLRFKAPKTKHGRRSITLPSFAVDELRSHWKGQQERRLAVGLGKAPSDALVFPGLEFGPRSPNSLTKEWAAAAKAAGADVTFHAWRHTHASQLIASGLDVLTISRRLGHGSPMITVPSMATCSRRRTTGPSEYWMPRSHWARSENLSGLIRWQSGGNSAGDPLSGAQIASISAMDGWPSGLRHRS